MNGNGNTIVILLIVYILTLSFFSWRWKRTNDNKSYYTFNGDQNLFLEDRAIFNRSYRREIRNLKTDLEKSEWTSEKLKDLFQMFLSADLSIWPYQMAVSALASCVIINQFKIYFSWSNVITCSFIFFVLMDLPRRFLAFHRNALIADKAINLHTYYYKYLKGKDVVDTSVQREEIDGVINIA